MSTTNELAPSDNRLDWFKELYDQNKEEIIPLQDYLVQCQSDPSMYASSHERLLQPSVSLSWWTPVPKND